MKDTDLGSGKRGDGCVCTDFGEEDEDNNKKKESKK